MSVRGAALLGEVGSVLRVNLEGETAALSSSLLPLGLVAPVTHQVLSITKVRCPGLLWERPRYRWLNLRGWRAKCP